MGDRMSTKRDISACVARTASMALTQRTGTDRETSQYLLDTFGRDKAGEELANQAAVAAIKKGDVQLRTPSVALQHAVGLSSRNEARRVLAFGAHRDQYVLSAASRILQHRSSGGQTSDGEAFTFTFQFYQGDNRCDKDGQLRANKKEIRVCCAQLSMQTRLTQPTS